MAKKKATKKAKTATNTGNKSQAIRDYLAANPTAGNQAVAAALNKRGFDITANYVGTVKTNMKKKTTKRSPAKKKVVAKRKTAAKRKAPAKRKRAVTKRKAARKKRAADDLVSVSVLREAKAFAAKLGGIQQARAAINAWASLEE
jgi:hypothetical protein